MSKVSCAIQAEFSLPAEKEDDAFKLAEKIRNLLTSAGVTDVFVEVVDTPQMDNDDEDPDTYFWEEDDAIPWLPN